MRGVILALTSVFVFSESAYGAKDEVNPYKTSIHLPESSFEEMVDCVIVNYHEFLLFDSLANGKVDVPENMTPASIIQQRERRLFFLRSWASKLAFAEKDTVVQTDDFDNSFLHMLKQGEGVSGTFSKANMAKLSVCDQHVVSAAQKASDQ